MHIWDSPLSELDRFWGVPRVGARPSRQPLYIQFPIEPRRGKRCGSPGSLRGSLPLTAQAEGSANGQPLNGRFLDQFAAQLVP
jgi:hypothetical protein